MYPHLTEFEENRREIERERKLRREIRAARAEARERRKTSPTSLLTRIRQALRPRTEPCPELPCPEPSPESA